MIEELASQPPDLQPTPQLVQQTQPAQSMPPTKPDLVDPDIIERKTGKTLFEVGVWEIIWRNFLAGLSRGLGNLILLIIFSLILGNLFITYVWPYLEPIVDSFYSTNQLLDFVEGYMHTQEQPGISR